MASWATWVEYHDSSSVASISTRVKMLNRTIASCSDAKTWNVLRKNRAAGVVLAGASLVLGDGSACNAIAGGATVVTPTTALAGCTAVLEGVGRGAACGCRDFLRAMVHSSGESRTRRR